MLTPLDILIGPALRHPQGPREGEVPGSGQPFSPVVAIAVTLASTLAIGWAVRTMIRTGIKDREGRQE